MADLDEEIRRQAAIASLLTRDDSGDSYAASMAPEVIKPDTQEDYHKLIDQAFPKVAEDQPEGLSKAPTIAEDQPTGPPKLAPTPIVPGLLTDPESGSRYVKDPTAESGIVPYAEPATPADEAAFKPGDVTLPKSEVLGPAPRAQLVDPDPDRNYFELNRADQPVPGFVPGSKNAIVNPAAGVVPPTPRPAYPDRIVTPEEASGTKSVVNAPAAAAPAPTQTQAPAPTQTQAPAPTQTQITQPTSNDDYNKLMDSWFPSAKAADTSSAPSPTTGEFQPDTSGSTRLNARTNNPGALGIAKWEEKYGVTSSGVTDTGHYVAQFPSKEAGAAAQFDLWRRSGQFNGQTLKNAITNWIGPGEHGEAEYISQATGIPLDQVIDEAFLKSPAGIRLMQAQAHYEGANVLTAEQWKRGQDWAYGGVAPTGETSTAAAPAQNKMPWDDWAKLSPADQAAAEKEGADFRTQQVSSLDKLNRDTPNPKQFWEKLQNHIEGVTDSQRQAYAENFKKEVTAHAQDFYGEKDPEKAFTKAISDPGLEAYITNIGRGLAGAVGEADIGIALVGKSIDRNRADGFMNLVHPDSTGEGRAAFLKALTDIQDTRHRHDVFNEIYGNLPQNTKDAIGDPASILDSIDHLANPAEQADLNKRIAAKKAWVDQQLAGSPELKGTSAGWWTTGTGENLFNTVAALVPGGIGAVVRTSTLGAQMYSSNMDRIAQEHPDWSSDKVSEEASKSAFMTLAPSEAVLAASHGLTAPLLKWAGSLAEKPIVRFGIGGGVQVAAAGVGGALGQVGTNVAENKDLLKDVPQAAGSAIVQSLPFAVHGGIGALGHEPVVKAPEPVASEHGPAVGPAADYVIQHPEERTSSTVGPEEGPLLPKTFEVPIKGEMHGPAFGQLYPEPIEGDEHGPAAFARNVFTPAELRSKIEDLAGGNFSPEQLRQEIANLQPDNLTLQPEIARGLAPAREPVTLPEAIRKAKADAVAAKLGGTPPQPTQGVKPRPVAGDFPTPAHAAVYQDLVSRGMDESHTRFLVSRAKGTTEAEILTDVQTQMRANGTTPPPKPGNISGEEPWAQHEANKSTVNGVINELTKGVANKYAEERMKAGELGPIDPNTGLTTEALMARASKMRPQEVQDHINNFMENRGGDPRDHAAAVRTREAFLTDRNRALSLKAETNPHDLFAQSDAAVARKALNDFYVKGGPISRMKETFHVHGVGLQGEPSIDLSTYGGLHDKFLRETGKPPPPGAKPRLKKAAERVRTTHSDEYKARDKVDKAIDKDGRKKIPSIEEVRDYIAKRMTQMPCRK